MDNWQTIAVFSIVALTAAAFGVRAWRKARSAGKAGCSDACGCEKPTLKRDPVIEEAVKRHN